MADEYRESNNQTRERERMKGLLRMFDAQDKERTPTMVSFDDETHSLKIMDESYGYLTVKVRERPGMAELHVIRFRKKPKLGVVYTFYKGDRLSDLSIEQALIPALEAAAVAHAAAQAEALANPKPREPKRKAGPK